MFEKAEKYVLLILGLCVWVFVPFYLVRDLGEYARANAELYYENQVVPLIVFILVTRDCANIGGFCAGISTFLILFSAVLRSFHSADAALGWILYPLSLLIGLLTAVLVVLNGSDKRRPVIQFFLVGGAALAGFLALPVLLWNVQFLKLLN